MTESKRKEELSKSYLNAICAACGVSMEVNVHDDDSVDAFLKKVIIRADGIKYNANISVQLKSTSLGDIECVDHYAYPLKRKNYDDLRMPATAKPYLFLLVLPGDESAWITHSIEELVIRKCMFWLDLKSLPDSDNINSVTVHIPKANTVSPETLDALMKSIANEDEL